MSLDIDAIDIHRFRELPAPNNNDSIVLYTVTSGRYLRPIIISLWHDFTGNLDVLTLLKPAGTDNTILLDVTLDKPTNFTLFTGHLRGFWLKSGWQLVVDRSNVTVAGVIHFHMMCEERSSYTEPKKEMGVMKTQPRWSIPSIFKR